MGGTRALEVSTEAWSELSLWDRFAQAVQTDLLNLPRGARTTAADHDGFHPASRTRAPVDMAINRMLPATLLALTSGPDQPCLPTLRGAATSGHAAAATGAPLDTHLVPSRDPCVAA
jgi:hypothetical protein